MSIIYILLIAVGVLIGIASLFALISRLIIWGTYVKGNSTLTDNGLTAEETANMLLEQLDLSDVKVEQLGWFKASMYGNHYSARKKTIYLRKNIFNKATITAVALATQKVALAVQHKNKDKSFAVKSKLQPFILLAPILFIPLALVGVLLDFAISSQVGTISIVSIILGLLFYLLAFIFTLVNIPVEKKANAMAMKMIVETNIIEANQQGLVKKVYKAYILAYIADFIMSLLYLVQFILRIVFKILERK